MCLGRSGYEEAVFKKKYKNKRKLVVWKMVYVEDGEVKAPYRHIRMNSGWYKSNLTLIERVNLLYKFQEYPHYGSSIYKGIHVYRTRKEARSMTASYTGRKFVRCEVLVRDVIGVNANQIAATKIWIPKSEMDRVRKSKKAVQQW